MKNNFLLEYIEKDSILHKMNGAANLICFLLWTTAIMLTYDTRFLIFLTVFGFFLFKVSKIKFREIKLVFYLISIFLILNLMMIFLFSPLEGTKIYGTRHDIFRIAGIYILTWEQLFYEFNIFVKYISVIPVALLFIVTTHPSEFAASVNYTLMPLIFSSIEKIDIISNAMLLRGFGKKNRRTWYCGEKMTLKDIIGITVTIIFVIISIILIKINNGRFFNPFV